MKTAAVAAVALSLLLGSCSKNDDDNTPTDLEIIAPNVNLTVLTQDNKLSSFNAQSGASLTQVVSITGMVQSGENMLAIDYRPATGQLYGVSSGSRVYVINPTTGVARAVGSAPFTPAIDGTAVGIDFNPTVDRIRLVSSNGQNLRLNPETGTVVATDGIINGAAGAKVSSVAYTESYAGASTTILYDIDLTNKKLYKQDAPNAGTLVEVGSLGKDVTEVVDFDISPDNKAALAGMTVGGVQGFYAIDLTNGKAYKAASFQNKIRGLAIYTNPVAYGVSTNNELLIFNPANNGTLAPVVKAIGGGLQPNEQIVGIDFRPFNGQLYGLGSTSRLYTINLATGEAAAVGTAQFSTPLSGTSFGFDFNPLVDLIRVVSNTGQNMRVNPTTGAVVGVDGALNPAAGQFVNGAAYTNNYVGATETTLYDINSQTGKLYKQDPASGTLTEVGSLGIAITEANGFDISAMNNAAYGIFTVGTNTRFYGINLQTGAVTGGGTFTQGVRGFALGLGF